MYKHANRQNVRQRKRRRRRPLFGLFNRVKQTKQEIHSGFLYFVYCVYDKNPKHWYKTNSGPLDAGLYPGMVEELQS
jgi:hypothetical protein